MGGSQSSRKLTVENENAIQVSQEALDRIQMQLTTKRPSSQPEYSELTPLPPPDPKKMEEHAAEEAYWARRIENLKKAHESISNGMIQEYQKTLKEADELFKLVEQSEVTRGVPPCQEEKARVLQCYSANPHQTLLCSSVVSEFNECVCKSRISAVTAS